MIVSIYNRQNSIQIYIYMLLKKTEETAPSVGTSALRKGWSRLLPSFGGAGGGYTLNLKCMMSPSCTT